MKRWIGLVFSLACGTGAWAACGSETPEQQCEDGCTRQQACSDVDPNLKAADCSEVCAKIASIVDNGGCDAQYQSVLDCITNASNVCGGDGSLFTGPACYSLGDSSTPGGKLSACTELYCLGHDCTLYPSQAGSGGGPP